MTSPARIAHTETDLISLRSRDVERRSRQASPEDVASAEASSSAWVPVDMEDIGDLSVLRSRIDISHPLLGESHTRDTEEDDDDNEVEKEDNEECECAEQKQTFCCNPKGICEIMARGFCEALNNIISCIRENLTKKQIFMLLGAVVAAVCRTKNVAVSTIGSETRDEATPDAASTVSEGSDVAADATDVLNTIVDVVVNATSVGSLEGTAGGMTECSSSTCHVAGQI